MPITFSVIIPNFNHAKYLKQRIDSILQQDFQEFEVIILDDFSQDDSREIIERYREHPKVSNIIYNSENSGLISEQWERGIKLARGEWIWMAESDDYCDTRFLREAVDMINANKEAGIFYADGYIIDQSTTTGSHRFSQQKNKLFNTTKWDKTYLADGLRELNECMKFDCTINNMSGVVFKKSLFPTNLSQLHQFKYFPDWFLLLQLCLVTKISYSPLPLNCYRKHSESHLNRAASIVTTRIEYFRIFSFLYRNENVTEKKQLLNYFSFHYLNFGLLTDGLRSGGQIVRSYFRIDRKLALKTLNRIIMIKLLRKKQP